MNTPLTPVKAGEIMEAVIARGDLASLTPEDRAKYYVRVCESVGLNPMTKPFEYITLNGKLTLYARKDATDQLRAIHKVSVADLTETVREGVCIVTCKVINGSGRTDMATGAVTVVGLKGDALANALMKAETKAKRRATLSICGLGFLDETEIETIPAGAKLEHPTNAIGGKTTLPKKDARGIYEKLQAEVRGLSDREVARDWWGLNIERIKLLPEDWQDILEMQHREALLDLQRQEEAQVVWGEDEIESEYLAMIRGGLKLVTSPESMAEMRGLITAWKKPITSEERQRADALIREHESALKLS